MLAYASLHYALVGCLLHATIVSARVGIKIPIIVNATTVHTVAFSFLIIFSVLTGFLFLAALARVFGAKDELPPDVSPIRYDTGRLFDWLSFFAIALWWAQLIIYTIYVQDVYMRKPRRDFPDSAYIARYVLEELTDVFIAAGTLQLVHNRRKIHVSIMVPFSPLKKAFDVGLLIAQLGIIGYTTAFLAFSVAEPRSNSKYLNWLTSYYVYTTVYVMVVVNIMATMSLFKKILKTNYIVDGPRKHASVISGSLFVHALFKIVVAILYSQYNNAKVDYDVLRVFEVIVFGLTYFFAMIGLIIAGSKSEEDEKKLKAIIKAMEKQGKQEKVVHDHK